MVNEITNSQTPAPSPVPPAGPSVEELQSKVAELEKANEGRLRDLQEERRKRQEAESRLAPPAPSAAAQEDVTGDELFKVVAPVLDKHPVIQQAKQLVAERETEKKLADESRAASFLEKKTGKTFAELSKDTAFGERLVSIANKFGFQGSIESITQRAYEIMELEDLRAKESERERSNKASAQASMPTGSAPMPSVTGREYSIADFRSMNPAEYARLAQEGSFKQVGDKIVYSSSK